MSKTHRKIGRLQKKILILLFGGIALAGTRSASKQWRILKGLYSALKDEENSNVERSISNLFRSRMISEKSNSDGTTTLILTKNGRETALTFNIENIKLSTEKKWDKKWRIVTYDVPEKFKKTRDSLRCLLKKIDMLELQRSIFIYPYECHEEIRYIVEFYNAWKFVRFIVAESIDNELELKKYFIIK